MKRSVSDPTTEVRHPLFARMYARMAVQFEAKGGAEHRSEMLAGAAGRVIEVGAGTGLNFRHYPDTVTEVVAVEPEAFLRSKAERAAERSTVPVRVVPGTADALPVDDESGLLDGVVGGARGVASAGGVRPDVIDASLSSRELRIVRADVFVEPQLAARSQHSPDLGQRVRLIGH